MLYKKIRKHKKLHKVNSFIFFFFYSYKRIEYKIEFFFTFFGSFIITKKANKNKRNGIKTLKEKVKKNKETEKIKKLYLIYCFFIMPYIIS